MVYFPEPYPDELLGSLFIRASHHLGLAPWALRTSLSSGSNRMLSFIYPTLVNEAASLTGMSPHELLWSHTILPYLSTALDSSCRDIIETQLLNSTAHRSCLRLISTFPPHIQALSFRRFCETCQRHDISVRGESYWHRAHLLPGVLVCPIHGSPLQVSQVPLLANITLSHNSLPQEVHGERGRWSAGESLLRDLASEVLAALTPEMDFWNDCLPSYRDTATRCGYNYSVRGKPRSQLAIDFEHCFGRGFLEELGLPVQTLSSSAWPVQLLRGCRPATQLQLRHILLRIFLRRTPHGP
jgi:hypothetical protein